MRGTVSPFVGSDFRTSAPPMSCTSPAAWPASGPSASRWARFSSSILSLSAASLIAPPTLGVVMLPPETGAIGSRVSPISTVTRSTGIPSASAACWAWAVVVPPPISWVPLATSARPSAVSVIRAVAGRLNAG